MIDLIEAVMKPQFVVMVLASIATFVTVFTIAMPVLQKDRMGERMKVMATERDKMRAQRLAELAKDAQAGRLRQAPKGFMQQIVDQFNLRATFESEEVKNKLKMAGLRGQAPLVAYMFFRLVAPIIVAICAMIYLFVLSNFQYPPIAKFGMAIGAGYLGFYLPNMMIENLVQRRQASIGQAFPDALDMLLICVQAGMSIEAAFGKVSKEVASSSARPIRCCSFRGRPGAPGVRSRRRATGSSGLRGCFRSPRSQGSASAALW